MVGTFSYSYTESKLDHTNQGTWMTRFIDKLIQKSIIQILYGDTGHFRSTYKVCLGVLALLHSEWYHGTDFSLSCSL